MANTKYRIMKFSPESGEFIIRYYQNRMEDGYDVNIPLPINDFRTGYLHGAELNRYILEYGPQDTDELKSLVESLPTNHIDALVYDRFEGMSKEEVKAIKDQEMYDYYERWVSELLDKAVQERKYDGFDSLNKWKDAENEQWRNEAVAALAWGERVWEQFYAIWNDYIENGTEIPPWEELKEQFPKLVW